MKRITAFFALLSMVGLTLFAAPMLGQNQEYPFPGYPPEFAPSLTVRIPAPAAPRAPQAKFTKLKNAAPNRYIVVLQDDAVSKRGTATERRARVADLARGMLPGGAEIESVYGTVFRGFSVKSLDEAAAIALSKDPRVELVESDSVDGSTTTTQTSAPGGLDRIDQASGLDTNYNYDRTGSGVTVYDIGPGVRTTHQEFGSPTRAFIAADLVAADGITAEMSVCTVTSTSNDCDGHETSMLSIVGGSTFGVAKGASLGSVKIMYLDPNPTLHQVFLHSRVIRGVEWVTDHHNANPTQTEVANLSFQMGTDTMMARAIQASFKAGVTFAISSGNNNRDTSVSTTQLSPSEVGYYYALVTGAANQNDDTRFLLGDQSSDYGSRLALWSPGSNIPAATSGTVTARNSSDTATNSSGGTSRASAHTAGVAALYLQGRTGMNDCGSHPMPERPSIRSLSPVFMRRLQRLITGSLLSL
jgi:large repetitive protein